MFQNECNVSAAGEIADLTQELSELKATVNGLNDLVDAQAKSNVALSQSMNALNQTVQNLPKEKGKDNM